MYPGHAARAELVRQGVVGQATNVQVSSTHTYHAIALIRSLLAADDHRVAASTPAACQDHLLGLGSDSSLTSGGTVTTEAEPWCSPAGT
jgi:hypothetical protein